MRWIPIPTQHVRAKDAYERVVADNPGHAKVLQQLGWLYHQDGSSFQNQELAIQYLTKSLEAGKLLSPHRGFHSSFITDPSDAQSWYLLGRAYMAGQKYNKAYEAYQQAVYRDGRNPTFWCSIGVLYFQINQFRDALDAYSRAIRINPYISEVWFDLGSLYESCNNQISDAIDAYARASELDPGNHVISQRLQLLKNAQATGGQLPAAPGPQDVHPTAYASAVVPPPGLTGPPLLLQSTSTSGASRPLFRSDSRGPSNGDNVHLPPPPAPVGGRSSPGPFRGGPPPPVVLDESRHIPSHTPLAPMDVDRPPHHRDFSGPREAPTRGPAGHQNLLLHHPVPQPQVPTEELRASAANVTTGHRDEYFNRSVRAPSTSASPPPPPPPRVRSPGPGFPAYPPSSRQQVGPAAPIAPRSPYPRDSLRQGERDMPWERRGPPPEHHRDWDRGRPEYPGHHSQQPYYPSRSPGPHHRVTSPLETSPRSAHPTAHHPRFWDSKPPSGPSHPRSPPPGPAAPPEGGHWRYDPARFDARETPRQTEADQRRQSLAMTSPEGVSRVPLHTNSTNSMRISESPNSTPAPDGKDRRRKQNKEKDSDTQSMSGSIPGDLPKKERKRRQRRPKEEQGANLSGSFKVGSFSTKDGQDTSSSNGSGSRSLQPSPTTATPRPPSRVVDEDYDEGVADALVVLSQSQGAPMHSPTLSNGSRHTATSPRPVISHRGSVSTSGSRPSPPGGTSLKRPLSPGVDELDNKRTRVDPMKRGPPSPSDRHTPIPSSRHSPVPFRRQPTSHSPESRQHAEAGHPYPPSPPPISVSLPPHPRPIGAGHSSHASSSASIALPPIATLSPASTAPSPTDDRMAIDRRSPSPPSRGKLSDVMNPVAGSPTARPIGSPPRLHEKKDPSPA